MITLMMEAADTCEMSVNFNQTTRRNNPEDSHLHTYCHVNLKSYYYIHIVEWIETPTVFLLYMFNVSNNMLFTDV
jgi:hypothetical protein